MAGLRIWHLLVAIGAAALLCAVARFDDEFNSCSPLTPVLATSYLCGMLGVQVARWRGRPRRTGLILGLVLGPFGVLLACSNLVPQYTGKWDDA